ncbi:hypothetical protein Tsubulata_009890 [Turnera subulata]|uniref:Pentatricopeptide repeat-containing protein n=1 Tax=Turnera subulata TaxID=218843 RepID=A0A9Q0G7I1_9ROSI|nr:hypothetical protein Tsubulata_009890 [Turnera subulata]
MPPLADLIQKCTAVTTLRKARQLHALILTLTASASYARSPFLNNNLLSMYARSGSILDARKLFDRMPERNVVSYNVLISAHSRDADSRFLGFELLSQMGNEDLKPNGLTLTSLLQACSSLEDWLLGSLVHGKVVKFGFSSEVCVQTSLLGMYSCCQDLESARKVFSCTVVKDAVSWDSMILGFLRNGEIGAGMCLFGEMVRTGTLPTQFTFSMVLNACAKSGDYGCGRVIHAQSIVSNVLVDSPLQNALLDMYCSCGDTKTGYKVFCRTATPNLVSWNSMISGCAENGEGDKAVILFVKLLGSSFPKPDDYTFAAVIFATGESASRDHGKPLHAQVMKAGLESSVFVGTTLLSMYFRNGDTESSHKVFSLVREKDVVLWTEMIMGHTRLGDGQTAIELFCKMRHGGYRTDSFVVGGALSACADLATLKQGEMIHSLSVKTGCNSKVSVSGSLIDMYAKNGDLQAARSIFCQVVLPDLKCWNSILGGYSHHGLAEEAMMLFGKILVLGLKPDLITFLSLLSACNHRGLVEKGKFFWNCMKKSGIIPGPKHYSCMVSLLSRAGLLEESEELIMDSTFSEQQLELWRTLLSSCVNKKNVKVGVHAAEQVFRLEPKDRATHILLSNLYAAAGKWDRVAEMRRKIRGLMLEKDPGLSWIEDKNDILVFSSGDQLNPMIDEARAEVLRLKENMMKFEKLYLV